MKERITNILVIAVIAAFLFFHFGLSLIISGISTAAYVAGTRTDAVVTKTNVTRPAGDDADEMGATAVYADADGHGHELFVLGNHVLNEHVAVAYLPFYPAFGIVVKDYETSLPITIVACALSLGVFFFFWRMFTKKKPDKIQGPIVDATPPLSAP